MNITFKNFLKSAIKFQALTLLEFPFYRRFLLKYSRSVNSNDSTLLQRYATLSFNSIYWGLPKVERMVWQDHFMGGDTGVDWANYYQSQDGDNFPPQRGEKNVGCLDFHDASPGYEKIFAFLAKHEECAVIQVGASSGKEIAYFARHFNNKFIYTDIFDEVTENAKRHYSSIGNIQFFTASAEHVDLIAASVPEKDILIISFGSLQYVYPENLEIMFRRLGRLEHKDLTIIFDEPGNDLHVDPLSINGSLPRGNFSYTHNYAKYAKDFGFGVKDFIKISPYVPHEQYGHHGTVHLHGYFHQKF